MFVDEGFGRSTRKASGVMSVLDTLRDAAGTSASSIVADLLMHHPPVGRYQVPDRVHPDRERRDPGRRLSVTG